VRAGRAEAALAECRTRLREVEELAAASAADGREARAAVAAERRQVEKARAALAVANANIAGHAEALQSRDAEAEQLKALARRLDTARAEVRGRGSRVAAL
jgi:chromosome segregation ATPase